MITPTAANVRNSQRLAARKLAMFTESELITASGVKIRHIKIHSFSDAASGSASGHFLGSRR